MIQLDGEMLGALIAFASLMASGAWFLSRKVEKTDEKNGARVKDLHQRLDNAILNMVTKHDHDQDIIRIETMMMNGVSEIRASIERLYRQGRGGAEGN